MPQVNQCPFCGIREASRAELEIHLASDHPGRVWNDRMPDSVRPAVPSPERDDEESASE